MRNRWIEPLEVASKVVRGSRKSETTRTIDVEDQRLPMVVTIRRSLTEMEVNTELNSIVRGRHHYAVQCKTGVWYLCTLYSTKICQSDK